jgi:hypothetical protein
MARVEGEINLSALKANRVVLAGQNLVALRGEDPDQARMLLERADLSRLEIIEPTPSAIDLTAIRVKRWKLGRARSDDAPTAADDYIRILERMRPLDRSVWVEVEADLRNQGRVSDANRIYRAMRRQGRMQLNPWRRALDRLASLTLSYGTQPWRPLAFVMAPAFALLVVLVSEPRNVAPTPELIQALAMPCREMLPAGEQRGTGAAQVSVADCDSLNPVQLGYSWNLTDGMSVALRYAVPVIPLISHEDWRATHQPITVPLLGSVVPVRADAVATFIAVLGWVAWPISLLFFGSRVIRGQRQ